MTDPGLIHHTFTLERRYQASVTDVFAAWGDPRAKRRWFSNDNGKHTPDFRVGGLEVGKTLGDNKKMLVFESAH